MTMTSVSTTILLLGLASIVRSHGVMVGAPIGHTGYEKTAVFQTALQEIQKAFKAQFGKAITITGHRNYTTQVVSGTMRRMTIMFSYKGCQNMCHSGKCDVSVWEQPWMKQAPVVTFTNCSHPPK